MCSCDEILICYASFLIENGERSLNDHHQIAQWSVKILESYQESWVGAALDPMERNLCRSGSWCYLKLSLDARWGCLLERGICKSCLIVYNSVFTTALVGFNVSFGLLGTYMNHCQLLQFSFWFLPCTECALRFLNLNLVLNIVHSIMPLLIFALWASSDPWTSEPKYSLVWFPKLWFIDTS